jgi:outer membrane protein
MKRKEHIMHIKKIVQSIIFTVLCSFASLSLAFDSSVASNPESATVKSIRIQNIDQALTIALKNNRHRLVSKASLDIAEAQHKQALSAYWPQMKLEVTASRMDEDPNFIFPASKINLGSAATPLAESIANAQLAKMGITPDSVGLVQYNALLNQATAQALPGVQTLRIPEQDITLMDRDTIFTSLNLFYPLYTGGKRSAIAKQAKLGVDAAREASRKTDLQVIHDVQAMYYGSILAMSLHKLGRETLERFEVTLELTEKLYQGNSMRVKKTDYLRTQVIVSSIRSMLELLRSNEELAISALINAMGLDWQTQAELSEKELPFLPYESDLARLVTETYQFNPQMMQVDLGVNASEAKIKEAKSGHLPVFVLFGNINHIENSLDSGIMTDTNRNSWTLGLRMDLPIFNGFRTQNEVKEAQARLEKIKQEKILLKEGLALQVKDAFLQIGRSQGQVKATKDALNSALENRELNVRAYQDELVETKDVIEAQLMEFFINGQYLKALYDNISNKINLEFIIGKTVLNEIEEQSK